MDLKEQGFLLALIFAASLSKGQTSLGKFSEAVNDFEHIERANRAHVLWECQSHEEEGLRERGKTTAGLSEAGRLAERWQAPLLSEAPEDQEWAVQRARAIAEDLGRFSSGDGPLAA